MGLELVEMLAEKGKTFTTRDARTIWGTKDSVTWVILSRLLKAGRIERLEKGKYMIIPLGARNNKFTLHEFALGSLLVQPYAIAYWSALHHHGLTDQIPATVFVQTTARVKHRDHTMAGLHFWVIRVAGRKFFGEKRLWLEGKEVYITDPEKTVIDCLDKTRYSGGLIDVGLALKNAKLDSAKLVDYAGRNGSSAVLRRLGFFCKLAGIEIPRPEPMPRNYIPLDPTLPISGDKDPDWKIMVNMDIRELEDAK